MCCCVCRSLPAFEWLTVRRMPPVVVLQLARAAALRDADDVAVFQKLPRAIELVVAVCMLGDKDGDTTPPSSDSDDF